MLHLIFADRHESSFVQQHVGCLQHRIGEQPGGDAFLTLRFVLELRLALQLAERRDGREQPVQFGVLGDMGLDEDDALLGVQSNGVQADCHVECQ